MTLERFQQTGSAFHTEAIGYDVGEKWHQLRYIIMIMNIYSSGKTFDLGPTSDFYEGNIATWSRLYCARQYNKDNTDKFGIDLFVISDSTHFFVRHIYNSVNFNIHERAANLPTTIKVVVNLIITAGVVNNSDGAKQMCVR